MVLHEGLQGVQPIHLFIDSVVDQIVSQGGQLLLSRSIRFKVNGLCCKWVCFGGGGLYGVLLGGGNGGGDF